MPINVTWLTEPPPRAQHVIPKHTRAPPFRGASRNRFLSCSTMSVKPKEFDEKRQQIREVYGRALLEKKERKPKEVTFVTKVQIKSKKSTTAGSRAESYKDIKEEDDDDKEETESIENTHSDFHSEPSLRDSKRDESPFFPFLFPEKSYTGEEPIELLWAGDNTIAEFDEREEVKGLVRALSRRLRGTDGRSRAYQKLTAAYSRPTKGELSLNEKGPVPIIPVITNEKHKQKKLPQQPKQYYVGHSKHRTRSWSLPENMRKIVEIPSVNLEEITRVVPRPSSLPATVNPTSVHGWILTSSAQLPSSSNPNRRENFNEFMTHRCRLRSREEKRSKSCFPNVKITLPQGKPIKIKVDTNNRLGKGEFESPVPPCSPTESDDGSTKGADAS
ncbi:uncharacterized protein LOC116603327 isoform X2 [Nematostella vectensis]|nr:uncharacterized protein LOC116603327 isoform X2 [Nematostella vectensis]XP_032220286.2 uncharacterized protein LOC116603327 isoform X2 [Nematostella vectensis]XP_032220287.2 uncharacterized protein LOC116603327 isoform X2 [Nematostella vectensis]